MNALDPLPCLRPIAADASCTSVVAAPRPLFSASGAEAFRDQHGFGARAAQGRADQHAAGADA